MEPCFGIISWFPDDAAERSARLRRLNLALRQLQTYWPSVDIMILAQNWGETRPSPLFPEKVHYYFREGRPGILNARKMLREEFLNTDYGWIIMTDDDVILKVSGDAAAQANELLKRIYANPHGFAFVKCATGDKWYPQIPYKSATLNFGVVSRYIYEKEGWHYFNIEDGTACEDVVFPFLLHCKYADLEFDIPEGITHVQNEYNPDRMPSTWVPLELNKRSALAKKLWENTKKIVDYISEHKEFPTEDELAAAC